MFVRKDALVSAMAAACRPTQEDTMAKLTDTQLIILAAAASRDEGSILPLPRTSKLDRETADGVVNDLLKRKLVAERPAVGEAAIWRESDAGQPITLAITPAGLRAIAAEPRQPSGAKAKEGKKARTGTSSSSKARRHPAHTSGGRKAKGGKAAASPATRAGSKQARLVELLRHAKGASIAEMVKATGWQAHSVRGAMSGVLKKRLGLTITSTQEERGRVYRVAGK
jgi:hypothetical protein